MNENVKDRDFFWISVLLRLGMATLFAVASLHKFIDGLATVTANFESMFAKSWLPMPLVTLKSRILPFEEMIAALWLLTGFQLRWAWIFAGVVMIKLSFGMMVLKQWPVAADNLTYLLIICAGLYFSKYDRLHL